jgi:hypothetical protein
MFLKSSPAVKSAVKGAVERMEKGESDKAPTREETEGRMAARKKESESAERETAKRDAADLPNLKKRHAEMEETYNKGKNYEYADREQNLSDEEHSARDVKGSMTHLAQRIHNVKKHGYKQGGKINLKDCKVSTHEKNPKHKSW